MCKNFFITHLSKLLLLLSVAVVLGCEIPNKVELVWDPIGIGKRAELEVQLDRLLREKPLIKDHRASGDFEMKLGPFDKKTLVLLTGDFRVVRLTGAASCKFHVDIDPSLASGNSLILRGERNFHGNNIQFSSTSQAIIAIAKNTIVSLKAKTSYNDARPVAMTLAAYLLNKNDLSNLAEIK